jgi:hypothetical protein
MLRIAHCLDNRLIDGGKVEEVNVDGKEIKKMSEDGGN